MTAPMTAERRREIELLRASFGAYRRTDPEPIGRAIDDLLAEIDRLTAERDAAVVAEREACAAICDEDAARLKGSGRGRNAIYATSIARTIRSRPAPTPAAESSTPADDDGDTLKDGNDRDFEAWLGDR